jgi:glutathione S-transferase
MLRVHHLRVGRAIFTLWLIEELGLDYELITYDRTPKTRRAPPELRSVHPLGKSPLIEDDGMLLSESGAIAAYLVEHYDPKGTLAPAADKRARAEWTQWLHYSEGSAILPVMMRLLLASETGEAKRIDAFSAAEVTLQLGYIADQLGDKDFLLGDRLQAPDIGVAFVISMAKNLGLTADYPTLEAYVKRLTSRPAFMAAMEKSGG